MYARKVSIKPKNAWNNEEFVEILWKIDSSNAFAEPDNVCKNHIYMRCSTFSEFCHTWWAKLNYQKCLNKVKWENEMAFTYLFKTEKSSKILHKFHHWWHTSNNPIEFYVKITSFTFFMWTFLHKIILKERFLMKISMIKAKCSLVICLDGIECFYIWIKHSFGAKVKFNSNFHKNPMKWYEVSFGLPLKSHKSSLFAAFKVLSLIAITIIIGRSLIHVLT